MRFFVVLTVFCTVLAGLCVIFPAQSHAQFKFGQDLNKHWWEEGYDPNKPASKGGFDLGSYFSGLRNVGKSEDTKVRIRNAKKFLFGIPNYDDPSVSASATKGVLPNQYDEEVWSPQIWSENRGSTQGVIDDFYAGGLIKDQYDDQGRAVLEVGKPFLDLSYQDQRRVAQFVDYAYDMTGGQAGGKYHIVMDNWYKTPVGVYTQAGLELQ